MSDKKPEGHGSMGRNTCYANVATSTPCQAWCELSDAERLTRVKEAVGAGMSALSKPLMIVEAKKDGQIIINLLESLPADKRGTLLLDLEAFLKESIDPGLVVWLEPLGDRNSLRNLRGIEVKA